jgi:uncharacterized protein (TIGR03084 family)
MEELTDLAQEQSAFADSLAAIGDGDWARPSSADGWSIRDQVAHLADTEEVAADTLTAGPRAFEKAVPEFSTAEDFTASGCRRGEGLSPAELTAWWTGASTRTRLLLAERLPDERVAWGFGMSARTFATARLMEHWAHGLDIADASGFPVRETARLRHVAALGLSTLRYAFARARVPWPGGRTLRLELTGADGVKYEFGPGEATDVLRGSLLQWCRTATRRRAPGSPAVLEADGELAELAVLHARAYL